MSNAPQEPASDIPVEGRSGGFFLEWVTREGAWYASSFVFHMLLMCIMMLVSAGQPPRTEGEAPGFEEANLDDLKDSQVLKEKFEIGETPIEPTELNTDTLTLSTAQGAAEAMPEDYIDDSATYSPAGGGGMSTALTNQPLLGGLGGINIKAFAAAGPAAKGGGGVGVGVGTGGAGTGGGSGTGFGGRGSGHRKAMVAGFGGTKQSERAVAGALHWIARHQLPDGRWSLDKYKIACKDPTCSGTGTHKSDAAATAMALLPYLAAGQTHLSKGPYQKTIYSGLYWLIRQQAANGDLSGGVKAMYAHGLATIMLCEAYGLSRDKQMGVAAQRAINFIESAQHPRTGGWRYQPLQEGDTSVVGWQVMALKSGQMAYLTVNPAAMEGAKRFLKSASKGQNGGLFCYTPDGGPTPTMTAVGLLCSQYMGLKRDDPIMIEGMKSLMGNMPNPNGRNIYYWYYATQVLHNVPGPEWDTWNRQMRRVLIESQVKDGCAAGSWDPLKPARDAWAEVGGRLMVTTLSALTLEVYYRYLPLYKLDSEAALKSAKPLSKSVVEKVGIQSAESAAAKPPSEMEKDKKAAQSKDKPAEKPAPKAETKKDAKKK